MNFSVNYRTMVSSAAGALWGTAREAVHEVGRSASDCVAGLARKAISSALNSDLVSRAKVAAENGRASRLEALIHSLSDFKEEVIDQAVVKAIEAPWFPGEVSLIKRVANKIFVWIKKIFFQKNVEKLVFESVRASLKKGRLVRGVSNAMNIFSELSRSETLSMDAFRVYLGRARQQLRDSRLVSELNHWTRPFLVMGALRALLSTKALQICAKEVEQRYGQFFSFKGLGKEYREDFFRKLVCSGIMGFAQAMSMGREGDLDAAEKALFDKNLQNVQTALAGRLKSEKTICEEIETSPFEPIVQEEDEDEIDDFEARASYVSVQTIATCIVVPFGSFLLRNRSTIIEAALGPETIIDVLERYHQRLQRQFLSIYPEVDQDTKIQQIYNHEEDAVELVMAPRNCRELVLGELLA